MSLTSKFALKFNPKIRERGLAYFRTGAVKILEHSDFYVRSQVKGTHDYFVELSLALNSLDVACTCPYFADGEDCKHIWATMLAADSKNYLSEIDLRGSPELVYDDEALEALQLLEEDELPPEPQTSWQQQFALISNSINNAVMMSLPTQNSTYCCRVWARSLKRDTRLLCFRSSRAFFRLSANDWTIRV